MSKGTGVVVTAGAVAAGVLLGRLTANRGNVRRHALDLLEAWGLNRAENATYTTEFLLLRIGWEANARGLRLSEADVMNPLGITYRA